MTTETVVIKTEVKKSSEKKRTEQVLEMTVNKTVDLVREEMTDVENVQTVEVGNKNGDFIVEDIIGRKSNISGGAQK